MDRTRLSFRTVETRALFMANENRIPDRVQISNPASSEAETLESPKDPVYYQFRNAVELEKQRELDNEMASLIEDRTHDAEHISQITKILDQLAKASGSVHRPKPRC